ILRAVENAEDNVALGKQDMIENQVGERDVVVGIAASGRTPYVIGAMKYARTQGATVVALTCNANRAISQLAEIALEAVVGPEVVTGSSRMKAGTAEKSVLDMLTTGSMIRNGIVYGNLMVDVEATNAKLVQRQVDIVIQTTDCDRSTAIKALSECERHCRTAILMI
uniref:N-acetylmuramic acid 6-phosphate etherase n=1 Tax=Escherichia coli TaxID=562 RepID=UPI00106D3320